MTTYICVTCGTQFAETDEPPPACPICEDPRQYVPESGQAWTTPPELAASHRSEIRDEGGLTGLGMEPGFAIGQRALLVPHGARRLMWDCIPLLDEAGAAEVERGGGLSGIAISHPHYYSGMVEWARRFDCPVRLHADDAEWIMRPDPAIELWTGETRELDGGATLLRLGGHYAGGTVLHHGDVLLSGDIVMVIPDRRYVSFMWSYPNLIPLPASEVERIAAALEPWRFERIVGAWWDRVVPRDGNEVVRRSAERYVRALGSSGAG